MHKKQLYKSPISLTFSALGDGPSTFCVILWFAKNAKTK